MRRTLTKSGRGLLIVYSCFLALLLLVRFRSCVRLEIYCSECLGRIIYCPVLFYLFWMSAVFRFRRLLDFWWVSNAQCQKRASPVEGAVRPALRRSPTFSVVTWWPHNYFWRWANFPSAITRVEARRIQLQATFSALSQVSSYCSWKLYTNTRLVCRVQLFVLDAARIQIECHRVPCPENSGQLHVTVRI